MAVKVLGATERVLSILNKASEFFRKETELTQDIHNTPTEGQYINTVGQTFIPVRVVSGNGVTGYVCDIFENGLNEPATKQGLVFLANGNSTIYPLPVGTVMYAQKIYIERLGTNN